MDPRASDHVVVVDSERHLRVKPFAEMPAPVEQSGPDWAAYIEVRRCFIVRQPDEWVIVEFRVGGVRVGVGKIDWIQHTMPKPEGVN